MTLSNQTAEMCAVRSCLSKASDSHGFCTNCFELLFKAIRSQVEEVLEVANKAYLGRSTHPERRLLEHYVKDGRDYLLVVHWAANWLEIEKFEQEIIKQYKDRYKRVDNKSSESDGSHSGSWSALYISFSLKHSIKRIPGASEITQLYWRHRLWPDPVIPNSPVLLRCGLKDKAQTQAELDRFNGKKRSLYRNNLDISRKVVRQHTL